MKKSYILTLLVSVLAGLGTFCLILSAPVFRLLAIVVAALVAAVLVGWGVILFSAWVLSSPAERSISLQEGMMTSPVIE